MLYGTDYKSGAQDDDTRQVRRFRRDVMFLSGRPQELIAAGVIAGIAVLPIIMVVALVASVAFWIIVGGAPRPDILPPADGTAPGVQAATSLRDTLLVLLVSLLALSLAGGASAVLRRLDYKRQGGLLYYLHHPRSTRGLLAFFAPVSALAIVIMAKAGIFEPRSRQPDLDVVQITIVDRAVVYLFIAVTLSMVLYLVWELLFPLIFPTLSELNVDDEVARLQREDAARVKAEEERVRGPTPTPPH